MIMKKKNVTIFLLSLLMAGFTALQLNAQISQGGTPPSFLDKSLSADVESIDLPAPDADALLAEDLKQEPGQPLRVGVPVAVNKGIETAGTWTHLPDGGKIWRLKLSSEGAFALGVYYDNFYLPEGGELYLYNADKKQVIGAFTSYNNHASGLFATELIQGDEVNLEYYQPAGTEERPELFISDIAYIYKHADFPHLQPEYDPSWPCMINVVCEEGEGWEKQKQGVVKQLMLVNGGYYYCSGSLINNTEWDRTPYLLTAKHCGNGASASEMNQWVFYFNYEAIYCNGSSGTYQTMTGAQLRAKDPYPNTDNGSDFLLVELNNNVPDSYDPYYNGWDRMDVPGDSGVGIHHPNGDIKKISTYDYMVSSTQWTGAATHWRLNWKETVNGLSIMQGGSSGSPIFNQEKVIIGSLTGGYESNSCSNPSPAWYGKVYWHWDKNGTTADHRLKDWLDPNDRGWEMCGAASWDDSTPITDFEAETDETTMGEPVQFTDISENFPNEWKWIVNNDNWSDTFFVRHPEVIFYDSGYFDVKLVTGNPDGTDSLTKEDFIYVNFLPAPEPEFVADTTFIGPFGEVDFTDLSLNSPTDWLWHFEGGTPDVSILQNPYEIKYYASGKYDVKLIATNAGGSDSLLKEEYINVFYVGVDENNELQNLKLYPNPGKGIFKLESLNLSGESLEVEVFDISGNLVRRYDFNGKEIYDIDLRGEAEGIYQLNIRLGDEVIREKVSLVR